MLPKHFKVEKLVHNIWEVSRGAQNVSVHKRISKVFHPVLSFWSGIEDN